MPSLAGTPACVLELDLGENQIGMLGMFSPGKMVPEFDAVVFGSSVGEVHGPVQTQFGFHLILIHERKDGGT